MKKNDAKDEIANSRNDNFMPYGSNKIPEKKSLNSFIVLSRQNKTFNNKEDGEKKGV